MGPLATRAVVALIKLFIKKHGKAPTNRRQLQDFYVARNKVSDSVKWKRQSSTKTTPKHHAEAVRRANISRSKRLAKPTRGSVRGPTRLTPEGHKKKVEATRAQKAGKPNPNRNPDREDAARRLRESTLLSKQRVREFKRLLRDGPREKQVEFLNRLRQIMDKPPKNANLPKTARWIDALEEVLKRRGQ